MTAPTHPPFELPAECDSASTWQYDPMHMPRPLPPLSQAMLRAVNTYAFGLETAFVHGFSFVKDFAPPPPTAEVIEKGVVKIWEGEFVPRIEAFCQGVQTRDYDSLSTEQLAAELRDLFRRAGEAFQMTMIVVFPFMGPTLQLVEVSEQLLGPDGPLLVASVLQGYANETSAAGSGLADLTALASSLPDVASALRHGNTTGLEGAPAGRSFSMLSGCTCRSTDGVWMTGH